jgi:hypothetical protein
LTLAQFDVLCQRYTDEQYLTDVRIAKLCYYLIIPHAEHSELITLEDFMPENSRRDKKISNSQDVITFLEQQAAILNSKYYHE